MWNTWPKRTKAMDFITKKTNPISTKRWKSYSTNICIQKRQRPIIIGTRQNEDAKAHKNEGEECYNIREVGQRTDIDHSGDATDKHTRPDSRNVRCPKSRVNAGKILWEQTITRHRHENAGLAKLKDKEN